MSHGIDYVQFEVRRNITTKPTGLRGVRNPWLPAARRQWHPRPPFPKAQRGNWDRTRVRQKTWYVSALWMLLQQSSKTAKRKNDRIRNLPSGNLILIELYEFLCRFSPRRNEFEFGGQRINEFDFSSFETNFRRKQLTYLKSLIEILELNENITIPPVHTPTIRNPRETNRDTCDLPQRKQVCIVYLHQHLNIHFGGRRGVLATQSPSDSFNNPAKTKLLMRDISTADNFGFDEIWTNLNVIFPWPQWPVYLIRNQVVTFTPSGAHHYE